MSVKQTMVRAWGPQGEDDEVDTGETDLERCQRNFSELLQELRVAQAGVQILFAFLLTLAFGRGLGDGEAFERVVYLTALLSAAASSALLIAPVAQHRVLFRLGRKPYLVRSSHRLASAGLVLLLVSMVASVLLAVDAVVPRGVAVLLTVPVAVWFVGLWAVLPWVERGPAAMESDDRSELGRGGDSLGRRSDIAASGSEEVRRVDGSPVV